MRDPDRTPPPSDLDARLAQARRTQTERTGPERPSASERGSAGAAWRVAGELVAGVLVGGAIGWLLDYLLGSWPWLSIVFFFLGAGAGIRGVYRVARDLNRGAAEE